jgi:cell division transport system ATP-binding protein
MIRPKRPSSAGSGPTVARHPDGARPVAEPSTGLDAPRRFDPLIRFDNVGLRYGARPEVLRDLTFAIEPGSFTFVTGASGAGKSSLLRLIYLAQQPSRGLISLFGRDIATLPRADMPALRRKIGVVFQDFRLLDHLSAIDNVSLPLRFSNDRDRPSEAQVAELLRWVGLGEKLDFRPPTLSGGEQQRIAIARAVINRPTLLLADEPTGNVDDRIGQRLIRLFEELNKLGTTVIIATHNEAILEAFDHPVIMLRDGQLIAGRGAAGWLG